MVPLRNSLHPFGLGATVRRPAVSLVAQDRGRNRRLAWFREQADTRRTIATPGIRHSER